MLKVLKKDTKAFNYKYTDLASIVKAMAEVGIDYYQYTATDPMTLEDYVWTVLIDSEGKKSEPLRGCKIVKATLSGKQNPAQEMGSSITYARRYSLQMALGWATDDDDANSLNGAKEEPSIKNNALVKPEQIHTINTLIEELEIPHSVMIKQLQVYKVDDVVKLTELHAESYINALQKEKAKRGAANG